MPDPTDLADERFVFRHYPLLGTVVEVRVEVLVEVPVEMEESERAAQRVSDAVVTEIERLESVFSMYRPDSELNRWKRGEVPEPSAEFCAVMESAVDWQVRSAAAFNPLAGVLSAAWAHAEALGTHPTAELLRDLASSIAEPRVEFRNGIPIPIGDCTALNLNAIAKGAIVDRALQLAVDRFAPPLLLVNAGGDIAQRGVGTSVVGIENPLRPYDNEPPVARIGLRNQGLATSGGSRRGFRIDGTWFSHVIDPRTGYPVESQAAISVVASSAMTADVIATVAGVVSPVEAIAFVEPFVDIGCLVIEPTGTLRRDSTWAAIEVTVGG